MESDYTLHAYIHSDLCVYGSKSQSHWSAISRDNLTPVLADVFATNFLSTVGVTLTTVVLVCPYIAVY